MHLLRSALTILALLCTFTVFAQSSKEHLEAGIAKHKNSDYKGAIKDYDLAIKADKKNEDAYFNRGTCALILKDFKGAMSDFSQAIAINPKYIRAYYSRASVFVSQNQFKEALPDLDKTIELDPAFPNALTLRGQIRAQTGNKAGACQDFEIALQNGDKQAANYLNQFCKAEAMMLDWPENENWKVGSKQENEQMGMIELIRETETLENWTEIGTMISYKGATNVPMDKAMNMMYDQAKKNAPKAKLTFIEKDESVEYPWILFTIESPGFKTDKNPESQLYYIVQGKTALYSNFRAVKKATIPAELKNKWIAFFKTGKVVAQ